MFKNVVQMLHIFFLILLKDLYVLNIKREDRRARSPWISLERWLGDVKIISAFTPDFP